LVTYIQSTSLNCSGPSQILALKLLKFWGDDGFQNHIKYIKEFYKKKCDYFCSLIDKYLKEYVTYDKPDGGMFLWMKIIDNYDSKTLLENEGIENKVLCVPGEYYSPNFIKTGFFRCSFSLETEQNFLKLQFKD